MIYDCRGLECRLISDMQEVFLVLSGIIAGSVSIVVGVLLGAHMVKKTYTTITDPEIAFSLEEDAQDSSRGLPGEAGVYDGILTISM